MNNTNHTHFIPPHTTDNCFECYQSTYCIGQQQQVSRIQQMNHLQYSNGMANNAFGSGYTTPQLDAICSALFQARDGDRLVALFQQIDQAELTRSETILVAYIYSLYHSNQFETLFHTLTSRHFSPHNFNDLQTIWHDARYKESQLKRGKELNPVEKYRLRRKYPPPGTIWDGIETVYSFKENSRKYLKNFYNQNKYPSQEQKKEISRATGLKLIQISNWFKNRRQRDKTVSDGSPVSSSSSSDFPHVMSHNAFNMTPTNSVAVTSSNYHNLPLNMFYDTTPRIHWFNEEEEKEKERRVKKEQEQ